ncbi:DUF2130 domain-containing protein [Taibaiella soli]|uniref:DUF2130 domain-containing protein n=2 Tax=Taibaiella soli TaxID=1649169 RepID=A0A2W2ALN8_9BACT|nr:DUF2130 domain-containing protein [Taibaiella soli]
MSTTIICPNCQHQFEPSDAMRNEIEKQLRGKVQEWQKKKEDEFKNKEIQFQQQLQEKDKELTRAVEVERQKITTQVEEQLRKSIGSDYENKMRMLEQSATENEEKLKEARKKELDFLQKVQELKNKEAELELNLQRQLMEERDKLKEVVAKEAADKMSLKENEHQMQMQELRKQLEDQKKLAEEMKRKAEQGSMQLQGEVQELALEALLRNTFPFDVVSEVGKGVRGADCIQTVRNSFGQECGRIIYESKRTKDFSQDWIEKLKADMRSLGADIAVIVTQAMPKDMDTFGEKDGVWICSFNDVRALSSVLRDLVMKVHAAAKSQENKGDKMTLLYNYLTSSEFSEQWKAIREGFMSMRISIQKERDAMEKLWKAREKQLEKVLLNAAHVRGSIEGIAGMENNIDLNLITDEPNYLLD